MMKFKMRFMARIVTYFVILSLLLSIPTMAGSLSSPYKCDKPEVKFRIDDLKNVHTEAKSTDERKNAIQYILANPEIIEKLSKAEANAMYSYWIASADLIKINSRDYWKVVIKSCCKLPGYTCTAYLKKGGDLLPSNNQALEFSCSYNK